MSAGHRQESSRLAQKPLDGQLLGCRATVEHIQSTLGLLPCSSGANNKRCRAASDTQVTANMYHRHSDYAAQQVPQHSMHHISPPAGSKKKARASAPPVHNSRSRCHQAYAPADSAVLDSFRPFLQQLAAEIIAGFSAANPQGITQVAGADAEAAAASILQTTAASPAAATSNAYSSWQPSELSAQHMVDHLMLMGEQRGSCSILPPMIGHSPMSDAVDAVAVVSRRTKGRKQQAGGRGATQKCTVLGGDTGHHASAAAAIGKIQTTLMQRDQFKAGSCRGSSNVSPQVDPSPPVAAGAMEAEEPMTPPTADVTAVSRLTAANPDFTAADTSSGADTDVHAQHSDVQQEQLDPYLMPGVLISSSQGGQLQQQQVSYRPGSRPTGADETNHLTGSSALQGTAITAPAATAAGAEALKSCRASGGTETSQQLGQSAAAGADSSSDSLMTGAGNARRIYSIRQHVTFLEATLGNKSPQVASAYLFLAEVLQSDGSQSSTLDAESALATALYILTSTNAQ